MGNLNKSATNVKKDMYAQKFITEINQAINKINHVLKNQAYIPDLDLVTQNIFYTEPNIDLTFTYPEMKPFIRFINYEENELQMSNVVPQKDKELRIIAVGYELPMQMLTLFKEFQGHENVFISMRDGSRAYACYIEPHGIYMGDVLEMKIKKLNSNNRYTQMFLENQEKIVQFDGSISDKDLNEVKKIYDIQDIIGKRKSQQYFKDVLVEEYKKHGIKLKITDPKINFQHGDEVGFCATITRMLNLICQITVKYENEMKQKDITKLLNAEELIEYFISFLEFLENVPTPKDNKYLFQKGGIMGYIKLMDVFVNGKTYIKYNKKVGHNLGPLKRKSVDPNYEFDYSFLTNEDIVDAVKEFYNIFEAYVTGMYNFKQLKRKREEEYDEPVSKKQKT